MNDHPDMFEFTLVGFRQLGGADRVRVLDIQHQMVGPCAPIPYFIDLKEEADLWSASLDQASLKIFLKAAFQALTPEHRKAAIAHLSKLEKEPPQSG